jgi:hypothetical protein
LRIIDYRCSLDIRSNNIKGDGLCSIADAVKFNSALTELFIWGNVNEERACLVSETMEVLKKILSFVLGF